MIKIMSGIYQLFNLKISVADAEEAISNLRRAIRLETIDQSRVIYHQEVLVRPLLVCYAQTNTICDLKEAGEISKKFIVRNMDILTSDVTTQSHFGVYGFISLKLLTHDAADGSLREWRQMAARIGKIDDKLLVIDDLVQCADGALVGIDPDLTLEGGSEGLLINEDN
jgi:hypothetical protein